MFFLEPLAFAASLLALPILLLYMLRLRRRDLVVSSTLLWRQVLRDQEANAPWQRLRRNLLLFLQLVLLALLMLALARPFILVPSVSGARTTLILDASASMNTTDTDSGTRFEAARAQAFSIIDTLGQDSQVAIIRAADRADVLVGLTGDRAALREALSNAQPGNGTADWNAALTLAANTGGGGELTTVILSDGGGLQGQLTLPAIPGTIQYVRFGESSDNVAVTALSSRALPGEAPQLFAQVTNYGDEPAELIFDVRVDDALLEAERQTVQPGESRPVIITTLPDSFGSIRAAFTSPREGGLTDLLSLDDAAFAAAPTGTGIDGQRRVLVVTEGNRFLEQGLRSLPGLAVVVLPPGRLPRTAYDLYVFDGWLPDVLPQGDMLIINPPQSTALFTVGETLVRPEDPAAEDPTANIEVAVDDPRVTYLEMSAVNLLQFKAVDAPWADVLVRADGGALVLAGQDAGNQIAILTFDLRDSDLPLQIAFPILLSSLVQWAAPQGVVQQYSVSVGGAVDFTPPPGTDNLLVTRPDGTVSRIPANGTERVLFTDTEQIGLYSVVAYAIDREVSRGQFAVNLFDPIESNIRPYPSIMIGSSAIAPESGEQTGQREFWPLLTLLAAALVLIEWIVDHRRRRLPQQLGALQRRPSRRRPA